MTRHSPFAINGHRIPAGQTVDLRLELSQTYTGDPVMMPVRVTRAAKSGPVVFISAAIHGNELNGTGIIHDLMFRRPPQLVRGTLVLIPVVNVLGFETQSRYLPDRRDLNRSFPGNPRGSMASRVAHALLDGIVRRCDFGIDLHSAASGRTNFPNVRGDLADPGVRRLATAFGSELVVNGRGPEGSLRREACAIGVPTVLLEVGEPLKMEPAILEFGVRGVTNVLAELGMIDDQPKPPPYQTRVDRTRWVRAKVGGILRFHVVPGEVVDRGQALATNYTLLGEQQNTLVSPVDGIVLGMTTLPAVKPGEPVCHIAVTRKKVAAIRKALAAVPHGSLVHRIRRDLATSLSVLPST